MTELSTTSDDLILICNISMATRTAPILKHATKFYWSLSTFRNPPEMDIALDTVAREMTIYGGPGSYLAPMSNKVNELIGIAVLAQFKITFVKEQSDMFPYQKD
jgi:hypothetical protein